ncbi:MAG: histidyl-tRNA synthetase [Limisphaerales bacterium]|jgi:histidyl-tRNA synthetase
MVQAVRGMRDVLPDEARRWQTVATAVRKTLLGHSYEEVLLPLLEYTELFARGVGESTDIVEKEMYSLEDRDGDSLSLRPEGTAGCVRALQENGLLYNQTQRVFYHGPMFRYEKPQRGRYRQFTQIGAEVFGLQGPDVDAELILLAHEFWRALDVSDGVRLEINTLGSSGARQAYRKALVEYLTPHKESLDEDSQRRLVTNPMRILDSKDRHTQEIVAAAPNLVDFVDEESLQHFSTLQGYLDDMGIGYVVNPRLVRGLDYYTHTVFEWITDDLGAQGTVCGGGRYDGLVEQLGGKATPAAGFGMGLDRLVLLHEAHHGEADTAPVDVYVCLAEATLMPYAQDVARLIRMAAPAARIRVHMGGGALKKQMKRADTCGAQLALIIGDQERQADRLTFKTLANGEQFERPTSEAIAKLAQILNTH